MKKFLQYSIILATSILLTVSCGGGGGGGGGSGGPSGNSNPTADQLKESIRQFSDITDAQGFVLTGDNPASARPALTSAQMRTANLEVNLDPNSLYKVTPDGTLERVVIADDSSEEINRGLIQPATVRDIDQNFMIMYFTIRDESEQAQGIIDGSDMTLSLSAYLVHKPTGLAYNMDSLGEDAGWVDCDVQDDSGFFGGSIEMTPGGGTYAFVASQFELKECRLSGTFPLPRFTTDDQSNIYLRVDPDPSDGTSLSNVFKIDTQNLGGTTINATQLHTEFPLTGNKWGWEVDPAGEYIIWQSGDNTYYRDITTANSVIVNLEQELATAQSGFNQIDTGSIYKDLEGKMYFFGISTTTGPHLFKVDSVGAGNFQFLDMGNLSTFTLAGSGSVDLQEDMERMVINGTLLYAYFINSTSTGEWVPEGGFLEIDADIGIVLHPEPASQFTNNAWTFATLSNGYFYYFGEYVNFPVDTVYRYNPATKTGVLFATDSSSPLVQQNLEVSEVRVIDDDEVWFRAVRSTDSATVFGTLDIDAGTLIETGTTAAAEPVVFIMQAILPSDFLSIDGSYSDWSIDLRVTTDASDDGSAGHELTFLSHQQSATQFFALVEFLNNDIQLANAATILTVDGMYEIVVQSDEAFIVNPDDSETTFNDIGGISAIGQAVELSTPLVALTGIGPTPEVTVRRVSLQDVTVSSSFIDPDHTVSVTLPRPLIVGELITVQLTADFVLEIDIDSATLIETAGPTSTVKTGASTGLGTASISVVIPDAEVGSPGSLSPSTPDQLDITEDSM